MLREKLLVVICFVSNYNIKNYINPYYFMPKWSQNGVKAAEQEIVDLPARIHMLQQSNSQPAVRQGSLPAGFAR